MTIKVRLWILALGVLVGTLVMAGTTFLKSRAVMSEQYDQAGLASVEASARNIDLLFQGMEKVVFNAAGTVQHAWTEGNIRTEDQLEKLMTQITKGNVDMGFQDVFMGIAASGRFADGTGWKEPADYDARNRAWFKDALAAGPGKVIYTAPYVDGITKKLVISIACAVADPSGGVLGVVGGDINLESLSQFVVAQKVLGHGSGILVDREGLVLAAPNPEWVMKENITKTSAALEESATAAGRAMLGGHPGFSDYALKGVDKRIYFAPTKAGFILGILYPLEVRDGVVRSMTNSQLLISALVLLVVMGLVVSIILGLSRSIRSLFETTDQVAQGDFTVAYEARGRDELALVSGRLNGMLGSLREALRAIRGEAQETLTRAESLAALSEESVASMEEVRGAIEQVAHLSESNSAALEETNAGVEEVSSGATSAANSATEGAEVASRVTEVSESAVKTVKGVIEEVQAVNQRSLETTAKIRELAESVKGITGFVATISQIADQTNLLALNAAIEAARAGEAGRGFAVVAEEVRKLAEESNGAARQVGEIIGVLQGHAEASIRVTEQTSSIMAATVERAQEARSGLETALEEIGRINDVMQNIASVAQEQAAASAEMATGIDQVTKGTVEVVESIENIRKSAVETTKASEGVAQEAQSMATGAQRMHGLLERFKVEGGSDLALSGGR